MVPIAAMRLPDSTFLRAATQGGAPLDRAWIECRLATAEGNTPARFVFLVGPTDADGMIEVKRDFLLAKARLFAEAGMLGYAQLEARWSGHVAIRIASAEALRALFRANKDGRPSVAHALATLRAHEHEPLQINAETLPVGAATIALIDQEEDEDEEWLPDELAIPIRHLIGTLARGNVYELVKQGVVAPECAEGMRDVIRRYPATFVDPPEILTLLMSARSHEGGWWIEVPLWSEEEGPSDLEARVEVTGNDRHITISDVLVP